MVNVSRDGSPKNQKEVLEILKKKTVTERKNAYDGLVNIMDTAEKTISKLENI